MPSTLELVMKLLKNESALYAAGTPDLQRLIDQELGITSQSPVVVAEGEPMDHETMANKMNAVDGGPKNKGTDQGRGNQ